MNRLLPVTIIVPCRNEAKNLEILIPQLAGMAEELIVVDGHSADNTKEISEKYGARFILDNRKGKGDGVRAGVVAATKNICVFIDADISHSPSEIPRIVEPILRDEADMVLGSRMRGGSDEFIATFMELVRLAGNMGLTWLINLRCNSRLSDSQNGFRAAKTSLLRFLELRSNKHTIELEMTMRALKAGARVIEVSAHESPRKYGDSQLSVSKQGMLFLWYYIQECFRPVGKWERK